MEKNKELQKKLEQFAENSDIESMTELLVHWEEKSILWLIFVESRLSAPTSTKEQKEALEQVKEEALQDKKLLAQYRELMAGTELEDNDFEEDYDDEMEDKKSLKPEQQKFRKQLDELMEKANDLQYKSIEKSIATYKEAIELMDNKPAIKENYEYLYAHYIMSFLYPQLGEGYDEEIIAYSKKGLEYLDSIFVHAPFTEQGQFYIEAIRACCNAIAWHSLKSTDTEKGLQELLEYTKRGCLYSKMHEFPNIYGTKASVLLKMNRSEEAYRLVLQLKITNVNRDTYSEIANTKAYQEWESTQEFKTIDSFLIEEENCKKETAEKAYQRLLEAEEFAKQNGFEYFEDVDYDKHHREKESEKTTVKEIEDWERKYFKLDESFKNFVLKYGYISFGFDAYHIWKLEDYDNFGNALQREWGRSKEQVTEWFGGNYSFAENLYVCGCGDSGQQTHYYILMDKDGFYLFDQDTWYNYDDPYTYDRLVSMIVNWMIEYIKEY